MQRIIRILRNSINNYGSMREVICKGRQKRGLQGIRERRKKRLKRLIKVVK